MNIESMMPLLFFRIEQQNPKQVNKGNMVQKVRTSIKISTDCDMVSDVFFSENALHQTNKHNQLKKQ